MTSINWDIIKDMLQIIVIPVGIWIVRTMTGQNDQLIAIKVTLENITNMLSGFASKESIDRELDNIKERLTKLEARCDRCLENNKE